MFYFCLNLPAYGRFFFYMRIAPIGRATGSHAWRLMVRIHLRVLYFRKNTYNVYSSFYCISVLQLLKKEVRFIKRLYYRQPSDSQKMYAANYYQPTKHFAQRYRERMCEHVSNEETRRRLIEVSDHHLTRRANYMLLFSIHGENGATLHTEVRHYFEWDIVVDNRDKKLITMYINNERKLLPERFFGDRKMRKLIYSLWFRPNSRVRKAVKQKAS